MLLFVKDVADKQQFLVTIPCFFFWRYGRCPCTASSHAIFGAYLRKNLLGPRDPKLGISRAEWWGLWTRQRQTVVLYSPSLSLTTLDTGILFTLEVEMDYPSETSLHTVASSPTDTPSPICSEGRGGSTQAIWNQDDLAETDNSSSNFPSNWRIKSGGLFGQN